MVKLNNKGYMLVEIIVASVLAVGIVYYLLNLTYKFKNTYEDVQQSYYYINDKIVVTKNIMNDLDGAIVTDVVPYSEGSSDVIFDINKDGITSKRLLRVSDNKIQYGLIDNNNVFVTSDLSYYEKEVKSTLLIGTMNVKTDNGLAIIIPIQSIYDDNNYSIKIFANM